MKVIKLFGILLVVGVSLEANYCVQVMSADSSERNSIVDEAKSDKYSNFDNVRVESRGRYLVLRVGDYKRYKDAKSDVRDLRRINREAYLRKCDFFQDQALFLRDKPQKRQDYYAEEVAPVERTYVKKTPKKKKVLKKRYVKKEELTYSQSNKSLWGSCKKCFIPVYEEEGGVDDEVADVVQEERPVQVKSKYTQRNDEIEVRVKEKVPSEDSFWIEEKTLTPKNYTKKYDSRKSYPSDNNKFDINEQFLP